VIRFTIVAVFIAVGFTYAGAQSPDAGLPRLDLFGPGGTKRKHLGYEGTPLAKEPKAAKKPKGQTVITSLEATFDQKTREAVFLGNVVVKDPEFDLNCDRLTAYLKKAKEEGDSAASPPPEGESLSSAQKGGGLDHAIADANPGNQVIIVQDKLESDGTITKNIGKGQRATYDAKTGDIVLSGNPSVQQGINLNSAKTPETIIILNRAGRMRVVGESTTTINDTESARLK
jgi:lipopolysaccharide export system protein LptA